jgi:hypothetical protein
MSEKELEIGNKVKVVGPSVCGQIKDIGREFTIYQTNTNCQGIKFYTNGQEYNYPASSLELVENELKIGDWAESNGTPKRIFKIESILVSAWSGRTYCKGAGYEFYIEDLRKLTPEEVARYTAPKLSQEAKDKIRKIVEKNVLEAISGKPSDIEKRLSAIEKRQDHIDSQLEDPRKSHAKWRESKAEIMQRLVVLEGERLEVCEGKSDDQFIFISIQRSNTKAHGIATKSPTQAIEWCEKVLDSMREG